MNGGHETGVSGDGSIDHSVNGNQSNGSGEIQANNLSLRVVVVGAGIGGLTAAIALRKQGHEVILLEQSRFAAELGAAVHLAPNANGILRRLGINAEDFGANLMGSYFEYNADGSHVRTIPAVAHIWQHPWQLAHRVRLHDALKRIATAEDLPGRPAQLLTSNRVVSINCTNSTVTTKDGTEHKGDLIIGADGVHSVARLSIPGWNDRAPFDSGKSAFRFMIPQSAAAKDPATSKFCEPGGLFITFGEDRRLVMYPTNNNEELNFVCIHPSQETKASGDWNNDTSVEKLLEVFRNFDPSTLALLGKADPATLKLWNLVDMEKLPTFVHERMALIGDAAHPFLPHQGQGAGMAIEDAASLAVMLSDIKSPTEIPERLKLYNEARYERAHNIQSFSRLIGQDEKDRSERPDMVKYLFYNFGHDEWDSSLQRLREWQWSRQPPSYWRQPIAFGPMPGPRQDHTGMPRSGSNSTSVTASIKFKTSRTVLQNLFPPGKTGLSFQSPGTVAYASITTTTLDKMAWLGGSGYSFTAFWIHGVQFTKKDGSAVTGSYLPVLFENLTDPIVSGREELGMPKLFSDIDVQRSETDYSVATSWRGAKWGSFTLSNLKEIDSPQSAGASMSGNPEDATQIVYRYMPTVGTQNKGAAAEEYFAAVHLAEEKPAPKIIRSFETSTASIEIDGSLGWSKLPTLAHIVQRLAEVPVYEVVSAKVTESVGVSDLTSCRRIE